MSSSTRKGSTRQRHNHIFQTVASIDLRTETPCHKSILAESGARLSLPLPPIPRIVMDSAMAVPSVQNLSVEGLGKDSIFPLARTSEEGQLCLPLLQTAKTDLLQSDITKCKKKKFSRTCTKQSPKTQTWLPIFQGCRPAVGQVQHSTAIALRRIPSRTSYLSSRPLSDNGLLPHTPPVHHQLTARQC